MSKKKKPSTVSKDASVGDVKQPDSVEKKTLEFTSNPLRIPEPGEDLILEEGGPENEIQNKVIPCREIIKDMLDNRISPVVKSNPHKHDDKVIEHLQKAMMWMDERDKDSKIAGFKSY